MIYLPLIFAICLAAEFIYFHVSVRHWYYFSLAAKWLRHCQLFTPATISPFRFTPYLVLQYLILRFLSSLWPISGHCIGRLVDITFWSYAIANTPVSRHSFSRSHAAIAGPSASAVRSCRPALRCADATAYLIIDYFIIDIDFHLAYWH